MTRKSIAIIGAVSAGTLLSLSIGIVGWKFLIHHHGPTSTSVITVPSSGSKGTSPWYEHPSLPTRLRNDGTQQNPFDNIAVAPISGAPILRDSRGLPSNIIQSRGNTGFGTLNTATSVRTGDGARMYVRAIVVDPHSPKIYFASDEMGIFSLDTSAIKGHQAQPLGDNAKIKFPMALAIDQKQRLWVGTEGDGLWCYDSAAKSTENPWRHFTTKEGLGDNYVYALASDKLGRIWAGHLNHGLSVFNDSSWQNYSVVQGLPREGFSDNDPTASLAGPLGPRIFAIATSPIDGDVWIASDAGLSRYSISRNTWSYFTRAEGLPSNQIAAIAFSKDGTLYVATQSDGLAIAHPQDGFASWNVVAHNDTNTPQEDPAVLNPVGQGLPSNLLNSVCVGPDDTVYVGTTAGLAWSTDHAQTFSFIRGQDYGEKVKSLYGGAPPGWEGPSTSNPTSLLTEDFVSTLAIGPGGQVLVAHRRQSIDQFDEQNKIAMDFTPFPSSFEMSTASLSSSLDATDLALPDSIEQNTSVARKHQPSQSMANSSDALSQIPFPRPATPATIEQFAATLKKLPVSSSHPGDVDYIGDDWSTEGDWVGRYGRAYAVLCGADIPSDTYISRGDDWFSIYPFNSDKYGKKDAMRRWVHWVSTDNPRSLYDPAVGHRRQAEWDDHGEAYPRIKDGPDLCCTVSVPKGTFTLSLYFFNKDGHQGDNNRLRDYIVEIRPADNSGRSSATNSQSAHARVTEFCGGVYKQFFVAGPGRFVVTIKRNNSYNTILSGIMIDRLSGPLTDWEKLSLPFMGNTTFSAPSEAVPMEPLGVAASELWKALSDSETSTQAMPYEQRWRVEAYRAIQGTSDADKVGASWQWQLRLWNQRERNEFTNAMSIGWKKYTDVNPQLLSDINRPTFPSKN